jgi:hypothetical protein
MWLILMAAWRRIKLLFSMKKHLQCLLLVSACLLYADVYSQKKTKAKAIKEDQSGPSQKQILNIYKSGTRSIAPDSTPINKHPEKEWKKPQRMLPKQRVFKDSSVIKNDNGFYLIKPSKSSQ